MKAIQGLAFFTILIGLTALQAKDPVNPIPNGATIFIEPNEGFEQYLRAAFQEKEVPLTIVLDKDKAEFVMITTIKRGDKPGWSEAIFLGKRNANEDASVTIIEASTTAVRFAYSVHKWNARNGQQSTAESIAKNLKKQVAKR